jgi:hypothetical protein
MRSAISPERLALLLSELDKVGRETCNAAQLRAYQTHLTARTPHHIN